MFNMLSLTNHSVWIASGLVFVLCVSHYLSPQLKRISFLNPAQIVSLAAGVAVGYVFLHMLPELVESRDNLRKILHTQHNLLQFADLIIFFIALVGFQIYYLLEYLSDKSSWAKDGSITSTYKFTIGFYFIYNFLITYTVILRIQYSLFYAILYTLAMSLHFVLTDRHIKRSYASLFTMKSRLFLLSGLLVGFLISIIYPVHIFSASLLTAFLSGAILYVSFSEEIVITRKTSILYFIIGTFMMAGILASALVQ